MLRLILYILFLGTLSGCATPTPYQPGADEQPGYHEVKISENKFRVTFIGNSSTSRETVENYLLYRAAEITLAHKADYFEVAEKDVEAKTDYISTMTPYYGNYSMGGRRRFPYYAHGYSSGRNDIYAQTRYEAVAYISLGRGQPVNTANSYIAKEVETNLAPLIQRKK